MENQLENLILQIRHGDIEELHKDTHILSGLTHRVYGNYTFNSAERYIGKCRKNYGLSLSEIFQNVRRYESAKYGQVISNIFLNNSKTY